MTTKRLCSVILLSFSQKVSAYRFGSCNDMMCVEANSFSLFCISFPLYVFLTNPGRFSPLMQLNKQQRMRVICVVHVLSVYFYHLCAATCRALQWCSVFVSLHHPGSLKNWFFHLLLNYCKINCHLTLTYKNLQCLHITFIMIIFLWNLKPKYNQQK